MYLNKVYAYACVYVYVYYEYVSNHEYQETKKNMQ